MKSKKKKVKKKIKYNKKTIKISKFNKKTIKISKFNKKYNKKYNKKTIKYKRFKGGSDTPDIDMTDNEGIIEESALAGLNAVVNVAMKVAAANQAVWQLARLSSLMVAGADLAHKDISSLAEWSRNAANEARAAVAKQAVSGIGATMPSLRALSVAAAAARAHDTNHVTENVRQSTLEAVENAVVKDLKFLGDSMWKRIESEKKARDELIAALAHQARCISTNQEVAFQSAVWMVSLDNGDSAAAEALRKVKAAYKKARDSRNKESDIIMIPHRYVSAFDGHTVSWEEAEREVEGIMAVTKVAEEAAAKAAGMAKDALTTMEEAAEEARVAVESKDAVMMVEQAAAAVAQWGWILPMMINLIEKMTIANAVAREVAAEAIMVVWKVESLLSSI